MSDAQPWSRHALEEGGFRGFVPVAELDPDSVPALPGVYAVVRCTDEAPRFSSQSEAGRFKGKDPSVGAEVLQKKWVDGPQVLYIGRAGAGATNRWGLRGRLGELQQFAAGRPKRHWGGRYVWQLEDRDELLVAWNVTEEDAAVVESRMLRDFVDRYGVLPFANLRR